MRVLETPAGPIRVALCGVDDDYILDWCPWKETADLSESEGRPGSSAFREFNAALHRAYGGTPPPGTGPSLSAS